MVVTIIIMIYCCTIFFSLNHNYYFFVFLSYMSQHFILSQRKSNSFLRKVHVGWGEGVAVKTGSPCVCVGFLLFFTQQPLCVTCRTIIFPWLYREITYVATLQLLQLTKISKQYGSGKHLHLLGDRCFNNKLMLLCAPVVVELHRFI